MTLPPITLTKELAEKFERVLAEWRKKRSFEMATKASIMRRALWRELEWMEKELQEDRGDGHRR